MKMLDQTPTHYTPAKAAAIIAEMAADDDDWSFTINSDPSGRSPWVRIEVRDEEGELVGFM